MSLLLMGYREEFGVVLSLYSFFFLGGGVKFVSMTPFFFSLSLSPRAGSLCLPPCLFSLFLLPLQGWFTPCFHLSPSLGWCMLTPSLGHLVFGNKLLATSALSPSNTWWFLTRQKKTWGKNVGEQCRLEGGRKACR